MIKKISLIAVLLISILFSCNKSHSLEYTTISGLIANNEATEISIMSRGFKKVITVNPDGTFSDTIKIAKPGYHTFFDNKNKTILYIKNGSDIQISYDYTKFNNSLTFKGEGSETSRYIIERQKFDREGNLRNLKSFFKLEKSEFEAKVNSLEGRLNRMLNLPNIDSTLKAQEQTKNNKVIDYLNNNYATQHRMLTALGKGEQSPKFVGYENYKGGTTSLDDFKGKYVYVDVWATWCGPCKKEIPSFKKITEQYKDKNIVFVGISIDDARRSGGSVEKAKSKWKVMVKAKQMAGVQLFADNGWKSDFIRGYGITGIPRFILIGPDGNIVNARAPRPSQAALINLFNSLPL